MASYVICNIETCPAHGPPVQMPHKFMLQTRSNNFLSQEPKIYGNFGIHQIEKNVFDMASKSTNVEWTAQCITTPCEYQQTKQTASTTPTTIFHLPIAQHQHRTLSTTYYALHLRARWRAIRRLYTNTFRLKAGVVLVGVRYKNTSRPSWGMILPKLSS